MLFWKLCQGLLSCRIYDTAQADFSYCYNESHTVLHLFLFRDTCMLVQRWRSSVCHWLTAVAMATHAGSASFPGIRIAVGTRPGGSALPSRLDTMSHLGMIRCDVYMSWQDEKTVLIKKCKNAMSLRSDLKHKSAIKVITPCVLTDRWPRGDENYL